MHRTTPASECVDQLTGLMNRWALALAFEELGPRRGSFPISFLFGDLDAMRRFNVDSGYEAGDRLLREIASAVSATVPDHRLVFRVGGDEFAVLLPATGPSQAGAVAESVRAAVRAVPPGLTITVAAATLQGPTSSPLHDLMIACDGALHDAKHAGGDRYVLAEISG
jgi:diguanylate cyclase (GGDEF)-like protein